MQKSRHPFGVSRFRLSSTREVPLTYTKSNPAQRSAEVVDEARSGRAVLILKGGATERVRDGVCFGKENAVANDTKSATTCLSFTLEMPKVSGIL